MSLKKLIHRVFILKVKVTQSLSWICRPDRGIILDPIGSSSFDGFLLMKSPLQKRALNALAMSFCSSVRLFVRLSPETRGLLARVLLVATAIPDVSSP